MADNRTMAQMLQAPIEGYEDQYSASTSNSGTLPSQTVTTSSQITLSPSKERKTLEGPSNPLVPTPVVSNPQKEPEQNPETSTEKVQNPNFRKYRTSPTSGGRRIHFHREIPKPKAKETP
ncbi:hypothetical protein Tco_0648841 [Tanacetum coccineum]